MNLKELLNEIQTDQELDSQIVEYGKDADKLEKLKKSVQDTLEEISDIEKSNKKKFRNIQKYMTRFDVDKRVADKWVANLKKILKHKVIRPDYKKLWLEGLKKVNTQTRDILKGLEDTQKEFKSKEMKKVLSISKNEGILDSLKKFWSKITSLIKSFGSYNKTIKSLPKIK